MTSKPDIPADHISVWRAIDAPDYAPADHGLHVREESIIQVGTGKFSTSSELVSSRDTALYRTSVSVRSVGVTVLNSDYQTFVIPNAWQREYLINGEAATSNRIYMPGESDSFYIRGDSRDTFGVVLSRDHFIETVAALRGVDPEDVPPKESKLELPHAAASILRLKIATLLSKNYDKTACQTLDADAFDLMIDAYLLSRSEEKSKPGRTQLPTRIVRKAEERFMAAEGHAISLADLCAAAGVSKSVLYKAFHHVCGEPPLEYFYKRRLMRARTKLLTATPRRSAVKRAALDVGFTELGRFSVAYRRLFGESPSVTLHRGLD